MTNRTPEQSISTSPSGEEFILPLPEDYTREFEKLQQSVDEQRAAGRQIVVVMGVGFVGAVMAGVVADAVDAASGASPYFVIGMQRPSVRSFWKIPYLNQGRSPNPLWTVCMRARLFCRRRRRRRRGRRLLLKMERNREY